MAVRCFHFVLAVYYSISDHVMNKVSVSGWQKYQVLCHKPAVFLLFIGKE